MPATKAKKKPTAQKDQPEAKPEDPYGDRQWLRSRREGALDSAPLDPALKAKSSRRSKSDPTEPVKPKERKVGRPSIFTQELADEVCERIAEGQSLYRICRDEHTPSYTTIMRWCVENEEFRKQYACAREDQGDADADRVGDVADRVLNGEVDPAAARVAIDALKWSAGKRKPKKYGDKMQIGGDADAPPIAIEEQGGLRQLARDLAFLLESGARSE